MPVRITGHHIEIEDRVKDYVEKEIARLDKFYNGIINCDVILRRDTKHKHLNEAEIIVSVYEHKLRAKADDPDLFNAFNKALSKVEKQLVKFKDKIKSRRG